MSHKNLIILAIVCLILGTVTRVLNNLPPSNPYELNATEIARLGQPAPHFSFISLDGRTHQLRDFEGKAVVINFWATWCPPCVVEFPQMLNLARMTKEDAVFLFISNDIQPEAIERFVTTLRKTHADVLDQGNVFIAHDATKAITQTLFQTTRLPETFLLDGQQRVADKIIGASVQWDTPAMAEKIQKLAENQVKTTP